MSEPSGTHRAERVEAADASAQQAPLPARIDDRHSSTVSQPAHRPGAPTEAAPSTTPDAPAMADPTAEPQPDAGIAHAHFGLRRADQVFVGTLVTVTLLLMLVHWIRLSGWGMQPVEIERHPQREYDYRIDVNRAGWVEWAQLPGIGEVLARRIVEDRRQNGPFVSIDDLKRVKGIGPKTVERIRPWLRADAAAITSRRPQ